MQDNLFNISNHIYQPKFYFILFFIFPKFVSFCLIFFFFKKKIEIYCSQLTVDCYCSQLTVTVGHNTIDVLQYNLPTALLSCNTIRCLLQYTFWSQYTCVLQYNPCQASCYCNTIFRHCTLLQYNMLCCNTILATALSCNTLCCVAIQS